MKMHAYILLDILKTVARIEDKLEGMEKKETEEDEGMETEYQPQTAPTTYSLQLEGVESLLDM